MNEHPARATAMVQIRLGFITTPQELVAEYRLSISQAREWIKIAMGQTSRFRKVRPDRPEKVTGAPISFRCTSCYRPSPHPRCPCGTLINPILLLES